MVKFLTSLFFITISFSILAVSSDKMKKVLKDIDKISSETLGNIDHLKYGDYIKSYIQEWHLEKKNSSYNSWNNRNRRERVDFFSIISGGVAIRESLQLDTISASSKGDYKVDINTLDGPKIKSHPFKKMVQGREYELYELSKYVPSDFYYVHFSSLTKGLNFWEFIDKKGGAIYKRYSPSSVDYRIKEKIMTQLALKENKKARAFYDQVVEEMAITGSDPFIRSGSDVTAIFKLKNSFLFLSTIGIYRAHFISEYKGDIKNFKLNGREVIHAFTKDKKVNSYFLTLNKNLAVISNSLVALKKVVLTYDKKNEALADLDEFKYMRSIYKAKDNNEDIFLYLSDPFIRYLVSPQLRIKEARRLQSQIKIASIERFLLLYRHIYGKVAKNKRELIKGISPNGDKKKKHDKMLFKMFEDMKVDNNGLNGRSYLYGKIGYLKPNLEINIKKITEKERDLYKQFVKNYHNYWKDYFDPIGIRIKFENEKAYIQTHILPLINSSFYNSLVDLAGGLPVKFNKEKRIDGEIFSLHFKFKGEFRHEINKELKRLAKRSGKKTHLSIDDIVGDYFSIYMHDTDTKVDFNSKELMNDMIFRGSSRVNYDYMMAGIFVWSFFHPLRLSIPLKNVDQAELLSGWIKMVLNAVLSGGWPFKHSRVGTYQYVYKDTTVNVIRIELFSIITYRLYYIVKDGYFNMTTTKNYIEKFIDQPGVKTNSHEGNISIKFHPYQLDLEKNIYKTNIMEGLAQGSLSNIPTLKLIKKIFPNEKSIENFIYDIYGFKPVCPAGGVYREKDGELYNSIFSNYQNLIFNVSKLKDIFNKFLSIKNIEATLEFTNTGIDTRVIIE